MSNHCQVLVVGGGPVGLSAALCATERHLSVKVLDEFWRSDQRGHAALLHGRTVSMLANHGLDTVLTQHGFKLNLLSLRIDGRLLASVLLTPPVLAIPQRSLERALLQELRHREVEVLMAHKAHAFQERAGSVQVTVGRREPTLLGSPAAYAEWSEVDRRTLETRFVVGADGHDSTVRKALASELVDRHQTQSFAQFEFQCPVSNLKNEIAISFQRGLASVLFPLPEGRMRAGFQIVSDLHREPDQARLKELLTSRAPWFEGTVGEIDFSTLIHFERRAVAHFGSKRMWLVGDSAHTTSPIGAQSLNVGLLEASRLIDSIAAVERHGARLPELEARFDAECRATWHTLLGAGRDKLMPAAAPAWLTEHAAQIVAALPASGVELRELLASVAAPRAA
ncbi:MAG TPA: FAD-dependent monooxygenase [Polyangiaceae bacterium]|jgi:2-polyprenyl-6-methoxyphenol hydroxylase-like FAD-dependent oxidoreductase